jgi:hypothetical protein
MRNFTNLYASPNTIRVIKSKMMGLVWHVARMGEMRNAYKMFVGKLEWKRPLGRRRSRWEDNIRMNVGKQSGKVWSGWVDVAQDRDH